MTDPITLIGTGVSVASGAFEILNVARGLKGAGIISALFDEVGNRTDGSNKIEVLKVIEERRPDIWWYTVKEVHGYVFERIPLTSSCVLESAGRINNDMNPYAKCWRWHGVEDTRTLYNGTSSPPNIKVGFIVVGYKPKALLKHYSS